MFVTFVEFDKRGVEMNELYPYCSKCECELSEEERKMNKEAELLFYPVCEECLGKNINRLKEIADEVRSDIN